jgi:diaminohydroxyphosphoribosylaminopyrimidine deaminase/5-amino-6-(5-phosphoribosylamino)uracil reductase
MASSSARPDLPEIARRLGREGITSVLVEGGGQVHAALLAAKLADLLVLYLAPKIVGGPAPSWVGGAGVGAMAEAYGFRIDEQVAFLGGDLRITAVPSGK